MKPRAHRGPEWLGREACVKRIAALAPSYLSRPSSQAFSVWPGHPPASSAVLLAHCVIPARKRGGKHGNMSRAFSHCILPSCPPSYQEGQREEAGSGRTPRLRGPSGFVKTAKQRHAGSVLVFSAVWAPTRPLQSSGASPASPMLCRGKRALMGVFIFILKGPPKN